MGKSVNIDFKRINIWLKQLPQKIKLAPKDQKYAYYAIFAGVAAWMLALMWKVIL